MELPRKYFISFLFDSFSGTNHSTKDKEWRGENRNNKIIIIIIIIIMTITIIMMIITIIDDDNDINTLLI